MEEEFGGFAVSTERDRLVVRPLWPRRLWWLELAVAAAIFAIVPLAPFVPPVLVPSVHIFGGMLFTTLALYREQRKLGAGQLSTVRKKLVVRDGSLVLDGRALPHQREARPDIAKETIFSKGVVNTYFHVIIWRRDEDVYVGWFYTLEEASRLGDALREHLGVPGFAGVTSFWPARPGVPWQAALALGLLMLAMIAGVIGAVAESPQHGPITAEPFWPSAAIVVLGGWLFALLGRVSRRKSFAAWATRLKRPR